MVGLAEDVFVDFYYVGWEFFGGSWLGVEDLFLFWGLLLLLLSETLTFYFSWLGTYYWSRDLLYFLFFGFLFLRFLYLFFHNFNLFLIMYGPNRLLLYLFYFLRFLYFHISHLNGSFQWYISKYLYCRQPLFIISFKTAIQQFSQFVRVQGRYRSILSTNNFQYKRSLSLRIKGVSIGTQLIQHTA